ncbi:MAG: HesA/MoeB/ThiF family protein [Pseudomonadota bacterium]
MLRSAKLTNERYARHITLDGFGEAGIEALRQAHVLIVGVGGIGGHVALALAAAGVGNLTLADFDRIDLTNLARQTLFSASDIGHPKVEIAATVIRERCPDCSVETLDERIDEFMLAERFNSVTCVADASDNFATRFAINRAAVAHSIPLISGSAIRWEGQVALFGPHYEQDPCYACVYSADDESLEDCQGAGVLASVPGTIGQFMATEVLAYLSGQTRTPAMTVWDARAGRMTQLALNKRADCPVCSHLSSHEVQTQ